MRLLDHSIVLNVKLNVKLNVNNVKACTTIRYEVIRSVVYKEVAHESSVVIVAAIRLGGAFSNPRCCVLSSFCSSNRVKGPPDLLCGDVISQQAVRGKCKPCGDCAGECPRTRERGGGGNNDPTCGKISWPSRAKSQIEFHSGRICLQTSLSSSMTK